MARKWFALVVLAAVAAGLCGAPRSRAAPAVEGDDDITGASDSRCNDTDLNQLKTVPGSAFEVVDTGPVRTK